MVLVFFFMPPLICTFHLIFQNQIVTLGDLIIAVLETPYHRKTHLPEELLLF